MLALLTALAMGAAPAAAPDRKSNADLEAARQAIGALQYDVAEAALARAHAHAGTRQALVEVLALTGQVKATVGKPEEATRAFEELLALDPDHAPDPEWSPKVARPFEDARAWEAKNGALQMTVGHSELQGGYVTGVRVDVQHDALKLGKKVRVTSRGNAQELPVPEDGTVVAPVTPAKEVAWTVELLDAEGNTLAALGAPGSPNVSRAPGAEQAVAGVTQSSPPLPLRTAGYVVGGVGAAMLVGGGIFALEAHSERSSLSSATRDGSGRITSLSQSDAFSKYDSANSHARVATILGVGGAAALAAGVGLWIAGAPVAVAPAGPGVALAGRFP